jgi:hypothetical protein
LIQKLDAMEMVYILPLMWEKQYHKPPMTGNYLYIPPTNHMALTGGWCVQMALL